MKLLRLTAIIFIGIVAFLTGCTNEIKNEEMEMKTEVSLVRNKNLCVNIAADGFETAVITDISADESLYRSNVEKYVASYLKDTSVGVMLYNVSYRRSVIDSDTADSMLYNVARDEKGFLLRDENGNVTKTVAPETTAPLLSKYRAMIERGIDVMGMAVEETHKYGAEAWFSIRMNDHHYLSDPGFNSSFSYDTPKLSGVNNGTAYMDFTKPAVQAYYKEYIREICEKYDIDGVELDFLRSCPIMSVATSKRREKINAFITELRTIVNEVGEIKGKQIGLAARIYSEEEENLGYGIDAAQWIADGSIDRLTVEGWYIPTYYNIPVEEWRKSIDERNTDGNEYTLLCGTDWAVRCDSTAYSGYIMWITLEQFKGFVSSAYSKGADGIYIFNHFNPLGDAGGATYYIDEKGNKTRQLVLKEKLLAANSLSDGEKGTRTYVNTCRDYNNSLYPVNVGDEYTFELNTGTRAGKEYVIVVGIDANEGYTDDLLKVTVNGIEAEQISDVPCATDFEWKISTSNEPVAQHITETAPRVMQFKADLSSVKDGVNSITLFNTDEARPQSIKWLEIRVE